MLNHGTIETLIDQKLEAQISETITTLIEKRIGITSNDFIEKQTKRKKYF